MSLEPARQRPQIGSERPSRRGRERALAAHDEPLDHRRVQQYPGRQLKPDLLAERGELSRREQQRLRARRRPRGSP